MIGEKKWLVRASARDIASSDEAIKIANALGITPVTAQLLVNRGYTTPEDARSFLAKETELFYDPFLLTDMEAAARTVLSAVEDSKKIVIYGDYDVDGVTAVSILYLYLRKLGADVSYYIPCRSGEGYGVSENAVRKIAADGANLIVTVDTGVTAVKEAQLARELGLDFVVTDHHECCGELPAADAVVNPHRPDDTYPFKDLAGVGVAFKLLCAMESLFHPQDLLGECVRRICMEYADLVAVGTIADVMPIRDENRLIVALGLRLMENSPREGIRALLQAAQSDAKSAQRKKVTSSLIGFTIAPRINAAGRIHDASVAVELFLAEDGERADSLARRLCDMNRQRQNEENKIVDAAYARIDAGHDLTRDPVIVLEDEHWHHGIIGIVASRITERYGCPTILISFEPSGEDAVRSDAAPEDLGKGSGRSVKGMNLVEALAACSDLLCKFGGHELAAGLTVRRDMLPAFRERINEYARGCFERGIPVPAMEADCELTAQDMTMEQAQQLYALEPYGTGNPVPVFVSCSMTVADVSAVGAGKHVRFRLEKDGVGVTAMLFRHGLSDIDVYPGDAVDVMYTMDINEFQGKQSLQFILKDIRLARESAEREADERRAYDSVLARMKGARPVDGGADFTDMIPTRQDFAAVYPKLKHEICLRHEVFSIRALRHLLSSLGVDVGYGKLKFILAVFGEMRILRVEELDAERDIYCLGLIYNQQKADLEKSEILQKLRLCAQDNA